MPKIKDTSLLKADLGRMLRSLREQQCKTLKEVAETAHISVPYLCQLEHGGSSPSSGVIRDLAKSLDVPVNYLLGEKQHLYAETNPTLRRWLEILGNDGIPTEVRNTMEQILNSLADVCTQYSTQLKIREAEIFQAKGRPLAERIDSWPPRGTVL